jgi:glucan biosynthesis protein C
MTQRRNDIDWLRSLATYSLFLAHPALVFSYPAYQHVRLSAGIGALVGHVHQVGTPLFFHYPAYYHIKNSELSGVPTIIVGLWMQFLMPLFFVLAGWSSMASLRKRDQAGVKKERTTRLLVPLIFGCIIICPPIRFLEFKATRGIELSFPQFLWNFFGRINWFSWSHLWFLIYLFMITLLYLPLLNRISRDLTETKQASAATVYVAILPLALIRVLLGGRWPGYPNLYDDWADFASYSLFFILGALLSRLPEIENTVHKEGTRAGLMGSSPER